MQIRRVKAIDDFYGRDISGNVVDMENGSVHLVSETDAEFYLSRLSKFEVSEQISIAIYATDSEDNEVGLKLSNGDIILFSSLGGGTAPDLTALTNRVTATETVNATQSTNITALTTSVSNAETVNIAQGASISTLITSLNALTVRMANAETVNSVQSTDLNNLLAALLTGITVIDNKITYPVSGVTPAVVSTVSNASATEGGNIVHTVTLNKATPISQNFNFSINNVTASTVDYTLPPTFSNGVTLSGAVLTVPIAVTSFAVTIATVQESTFEGNETYTLVIGGISGTGTINNDDSAPAPTISTVVGNTVTEGATLQFTVALSAASTGQVFAFSTSGTATSPDLGSVTYSNGVTASGGNLTVPAAVSSFVISVPTIDDAGVEGSETVIYTVGGVSGTGTISDNDSSASISTPTSSKSGVYTTISFTTSTAQRAGVEFGTTTAYGTAVVEDAGTTATSHTIVLEANADILLSPHGLVVGNTYNLRAVAGVGGAIVSPNITFVA